MGTKVVKVATVIRVVLESTDGQMVECGLGEMFNAAICWLSCLDAHFIVCLYKIAIASEHTFQRSETFVLHKN